LACRRVELARVDPADRGLLLAGGGEEAVLHAREEELREACGSGASGRIELRPEQSLALEECGTQDFGVRELGEVLGGSPSDDEVRDESLMVPDVARAAESFATSRGRSFARS